MINYLDQQYNKLIRPDNFIKNFNNLWEFEEWCYTGTLADLGSTLKEFEKYELYEYCTVIKSVMVSLEDSYFIFKQDLS